jgi:hypothetical protein
MYEPIYIKEFSIFDIFLNDNKNIIIISPAGKAPLRIKYKNFFFSFIKCKHKHTYIYILYNKIEYEEEIKLNINNKDIITNINKYPFFKDEIIMSTMVKNEDNIIKQWIDFHLKIGISRFIIYDNKYSENNELNKINTDAKRSNNLESNLEELLKDYIDNNKVILINWKYNKFCSLSGISGQTTQQNHSIWAFKSCKYLGLFDIDEYINIQNEKNIDIFFSNFIRNNEINLNFIGGFKLYNKLFYNSNNEEIKNNNFLKIYNTDNIYRLNNGKMFIIPKNVSTFSIHKITIGKTTFNIPYKYIYFNHYFFLNKEKRGRNKTKFIDNSINMHLINN